MEAMAATAPLVRLSRSAVAVVAHIILIKTERTVAVEEEVCSLDLAPPLCKRAKVATVDSMDTASRVASGLRPPIMVEGLEVLEGWESMAPTRSVVMAVQGTVCSYRAPLRCVTLGTIVVALAGEGVEGRKIHLMVRVWEDQVEVATGRSLGPGTMKKTALTDMVAVAAPNQPLFGMVDTAARAVLAW